MPSRNCCASRRAGTVRLPFATRRLARTAAIAVLLVLGSAVQPRTICAQPLEQGVAGQPGPDAIDGALSRIKTDPNLVSERKFRTLRWRDPSTSRAPLSLPEWLRQFVRAFEEWSRGLVWVVVVLAAALLAAYLVRVAMSRSPEQEDALAGLPSHVREMDIRPESLPHDIGAAARELWDRGEHRGALALLYRGALSRLVHAHRVPIRDSSTEGDCLRLATRALSPPASEYIAGLIATWQRSVYGHRMPDSDRVRQLCAEFDPALSRAGRAQVSGGHP